MKILTLDAEIFGERGCAGVPPIIQPRWGEGKREC